MKRVLLIILMACSSFICFASINLDFEAKYFTCKRNGCKEEKVDGYCRLSIRENDKEITIFSPETRDRFIIHNTENLTFSNGGHPLMVYHCTNMKNGTQCTIKLTAINYVTITVSYPDITYWYKVYVVE